MAGMPQAEGSARQDCRKGQVWVARAGKGVRQEALRKKPIAQSQADRRTQGEHSQVLPFYSEGKGTILQVGKQIKETQYLIIAVSQANDSEESLDWIRPKILYLFFQNIPT